MSVKKNTIICMQAVWLLTGCKENYDPPVIKTNLNLLVVDGFLNNSSDTTTIRLSRTRKLEDGTANSAETNSQITLEDAAGTILYHFQEMENGNYIVPGLNLDVNKKYKLRINTPGGKQYASDNIELKQTPPIDSVTWQRKDDGVAIFVNTHDAQNSTRYYRWGYAATWEYYSSFYSVFKYENNSILPRQPDERIYDCWTTKDATDLLLGSSAKLSQDVINMLPIRFIAVNSFELGIKYSILVKQYAITKEGYEYLENLKKITEQRGSIFDAQPSQLTGNIHSVNDPAESAIGFIMASSLKEKRIFIDRAEVMPWTVTADCVEKIFVPPDKLNDFFEAGQYIPITEAYNMMGFFIGYYAGVPSCVDCRLKGGTTIKPDFWP